MQRYKSMSLAFCIAATILPIAQSVSAQDNADRFARSGSEVRVSFHVPFGATESRTTRASQISLGVRQYMPPRAVASDWMLTERKTFRETRLGFTLEPQPQIFLNDRVLQPPQGARAEVGTAGRVGLGVGAVVLTLVTATAVLVAVCSADEDCFEGPYD